MAETTGFEPVVVFKDYNDLANRRFQPLSHVSALPVSKFQFYPKGKLCQVNCILLYEYRTLFGLTRLNLTQKIPKLLVLTFF